MKRTGKVLGVLGCVFLFATSCTLDPKREHLLEFQFEKSPVHELMESGASAALLEPSGLMADSLSGFACLGVNVIGPGIADNSSSPDPIPADFTPLFSGTTSCAYPGITSPALSTSASSVSAALVVPSGKRLIQVVGIQDGTHCTATPLFQGAIGGPSPGVYEVGRAVVDVFSDLEVPIANTYSSANPRRVDCGSGMCGVAFATNEMLEALYVPVGKVASQEVSLTSGTQIHKARVKVAGDSGGTTNITVKLYDPGGTLLSSGTDTITVSGTAYSWQTVTFSSPVPISTTGVHTLRLNGDAVFAWYGGSRSGTGYVGKSDHAVNGTFDVVSSPVPGPISTVTSDQQNICIVSGGKLFCFGKYEAALDLESVYATLTKKPVPGTQRSLTGLSQVTVGTGHICALKSDQTLYCWGDNSSGQTGNATVGGAQNTPAQVSGTFSQVSAGGTTLGFTCGVSTGGAALCWGDNTNTQLGLSTPATTGSPQTTLASGVKQVAAGVNHACAALTDGTVKCWGYNNWGQIGNGSTGVGTLPATVLTAAATPLTNVSKVVAGGLFSCALRSSGEVYCWGGSASGQLGQGNTTASSYAVAVPGIPSATDIMAGDAHACAIYGGGLVSCWGDNFLGTVGDGTTTNRLSPTAVLPPNGAGAQLSGATKLSVPGGAAKTTCALVNSGELRCWGSNASGQYGNGRLTTILRPQIPAFFNAFAHELSSCP